MQNILSGFKPIFALAILCLSIYISGINSIPAMDRDEARYIQATTQMLETNDFINIKFQNQARNKKPAGIYWLQAASVKLFKEDLNNKNLWSYRLPSLIGALIAVFATFWLGIKISDKKTALLGSAFLGSSILLSAEAHLAKTDAMMLAMTVLAQASLGVLYFINREKKNITKQKKWGLFLLFWAAQGGGVLIKGPLLPIISLLTIITLYISDKKSKTPTKFWHDLKPYFGIFITLAIALPWFIAIQKATSGAFVSDAVGKDLLPKLMGGQESHGAPIGYYALISLITLWPASLFLYPALFQAFKERGESAIRFLISWIVPNWLMFEAVPTKLPHYILPILPAISLIIAIIIFNPNKNILRHKASYVYYAFWTLITLILGFGLSYLPFEFGNGFNPISVIIIISTIGAIFFAWKNILSNNYYKSGLFIIIASAIILSSVFNNIMPKLDKIWMSREAHKLISSKTKNNKLAIASTGYAEPSLVYLLGTNTKLVNSKEASEHIIKNIGALSLVNKKDEDSFLKFINNRAKIKNIGKIEGFNYSKGRKTTLILYKSYK